MPWTRCGLIFFSVNKRSTLNHGYSGLPTSGSKAYCLVGYLRALPTAPVVGVRNALNGFDVRQALSPALLKQPGMHELARFVLDQIYGTVTLWTSMRNYCMRHYATRYVQVQ